jgi:hypothetical protein
MTYKSRIRPSRLQVLFLKGCIWGYRAIQTVLGLLVVLGVVLAVLGKIEYSKGVSSKKGYDECVAEFNDALENQENTHIGTLAVFSMTGQGNRLAYYTKLNDWRAE